MTLTLLSDINGPFFCSVDFSEDLGEYSCVIWTGDTQTANQTVIVYGKYLASVSLKERDGEGVINNGRK